MKNYTSQHVVLANGADGPSKATDPLILNYLGNDVQRNVKIGLPKFVRNVYHLPDRVLDLLEIAGYIFAADRKILRGSRTAVEYQSWSRTIKFCIRVRDCSFWSDPSVSNALAQVLQFMTGDAKYEFTFETGHNTPPTGLFDRRDISIDTSEHVNVSLFSGGLDSLSGALELIESTTDKVVLVSHQSQSSTVHTQNVLFSALNRKYPNRLLHYPFECTLRGRHSKEESQRTRAFLYLSIAYAITSAYDQNCIYVYENGITSLNLRRREDLMNARASRTTHPQTIGLMAKFLSLVEESDISIYHPYLYTTKAEILSSLISATPDLISSAVSCTRAFRTHGVATHCGECFQCIDRRIAAHSAEAESIDHRGLYSVDIIDDPTEKGESRTTLIDYIRQALSLYEKPLSKFEEEYLSDLAELLDYSPLGVTDADKIEDFWKLHQRHGSQVHNALNRIRSLYEDVSLPLRPGSLLQIVSSREYLKPERYRCVESIVSVVSPALGDMFANVKPKDEPDLNTKLAALLGTHESSLRSEHPSVSFACARVIPDHTVKDYEILIESKYIRSNTTPSKVTDGIAADLTKYPQTEFIIFVIYDPEHKIPSDSVFSFDIESKGRNKVIIVR